MKIVNYGDAYQMKIIGHGDVYQMKIISYGDVSLIRVTSFLQIRCHDSVLELNVKTSPLSSCKYSVFRY